MTMSTLDILQTGRDVLLNDGWIKNRLKDSQGRHCAVGAVWEAVSPGYSYNAPFPFWCDGVSETPEFKQALALLAKQVADVVETGTGYPRTDWNLVANYNNGNGWVDVLAMFDGAIADAEAGHVAKIDAHRVALQEPPFIRWSRDTSAFLDWLGELTVTDESLTIPALVGADK